MVARLLDCEGEEVAEAEGLGDEEDCAERRWESSSSARMLRCAQKGKHAIGSLSAMAAHELVCSE